MPVKEAECDSFDYNNKIKSFHRVIMAAVTQFSGEIQNFFTSLSFFKVGQK